MPTMRWGPIILNQPPQPSRWKSHTMQARTKRAQPLLPHWKRERPTKQQDAFTTLASDTEKALDQILESTKRTKQHSKSSETLVVEAAKRLNVSEFSAHVIADATSPEQTGLESVLLDLQDDDGSCSSSVLLEWLAGIDTSRSEEYCAYAKQLEEHGFATLEDLAQLESDDDVDQAMSEVGIAKFAHRLRIRQAIQRLHSFEDPKAGTLAVAAIA